MTHSHLRVRTAPALGAIGCLLLAGCGSGSATHADAPAAHANTGAASSSPAGHTGAQVRATPPVTPSAGTKICSLITEQEAGTALGTDPGPGQDTTSHGASSCMYGTSPKIVTVNLVPSGGKAVYDHLRARAPAGRTVDVAGVGDAAFGTVSGPAAGIDFYKGDTFVAIVLVAGLTSAPSKDQAIALAKAAVGRI